MRPSCWPDPFGGTGFDCGGREARRPCRSAVGDAVRMADSRFRHPGRRWGDCADLRDKFGRAGEVRAGRLGCGADLRRDRRARRQDRAALERTARPAQGAAHRGVRHRRAGRARRGGQVRREEATRRPAGCDQGRRPGDADLHVGHHRQAQGLPADPLQPDVRDPRSQGMLPDTVGQGREDVGLPPARTRARPRDHRRGVRQQGHAGLHQ